MKSVIFKQFSPKREEQDGKIQKPIKPFDALAPQKTECDSSVGTYFFCHNSMIPKENTIEREEIGNHSEQSAIFADNFKNIK